MNDVGGIGRTALLYFSLCLMVLSLLVAIASAVAAIGLAVFAAIVFVAALFAMFRHRRTTGSS